MYNRTMFGLFLLIGIAVNAQTVNVRGKVSNSGGTAVSNAIVSLVSQGLRDTTGADGMYSLAKATFAQLPSAAARTREISLNRGVLEFRIFNPSEVKVEISDVKGVLLEKVLLPNVSTGVYRLNIMKNSYASNLLIVHAWVGRDATTFRCLPMDNGTYAVNSSAAGSSPMIGSLAKILAVSDTLRVTATGFSAKMVLISSYDTTVNITLDSANVGALTVQLAQTHQTIEGFGLNTALGGGSVNWDNYFTLNGTGIGLSIVRVGMNSDGSLSGDLSGAKSRNVKIIGSVWTAPASWKDNNNESKGGKLLTSYYDQFATRIATFAKNQGLYAMSASNEPDFASCGSTIGPPCNGDYVTMVYTATEMVNFVKVLGPKLRALNPPVKLIAPEPSEWIHLWSNTSATGSTVAGHPNSSDPLGCGCFGNTPVTTGCASKCSQGNGYDYGHYLYKDTAAWNTVDIIGTHEYDSQKAEPWPSDINGGNPSKEVWETEVSGVMYWPEQGPNGDINNGIAVAGWIHSALVVGEASAWLYWWYSQTGDNEGLVLGSTDTKRHWVLGNYSKFVRPGYKRVDITGNIPANVLLSAYKSTGTDTVVVVAINKSSSSVTVPITITGGTKTPTTATPWLTSASANLASQTAVTVSGGILTATLAATSVTTFVCK